GSLRARRVGGGESLMAGSAGRVVLALRAMGIVAGGARELAGALQEALGLAQTVGGADDFEIVGRALGFIVVEDEIAEGFAGLIRERAAIVFDDGMRQRAAGGFEVALHADFELARGGEARGVYDLCAELIGGRVGELRGCDVIGTGAVAALTIDA